jgi:hypothetical protein
MASLAMKIKAERRMRELLAEEDLPQPDAVEYGHGCVRLYFNATKVVVVVDIDDYGEIGESRLGSPLDGPADPPLHRKIEEVPIPPIPLPTRPGNGGHGDGGAAGDNPLEPGGEAP